MKNIALIGFAFIVSSCSLTQHETIVEPALTDAEKQRGQLIETAIPKYKYGLSGFESEYPSISNCKCDYNQFTFAEDSDIHEVKKAAELLWPYAIMSNNAYEENKKPQIEVPGWKRVARYIDKKSDGKNGGFSADIYESTTNPMRVVIAYRGTDDLQDWKSNLSIGKRKQYAKAEELYNIIQDKYLKNIKIDVTGHSLGGGLAMSISLRYEGVDSYVFNASPRVFSDGQYDKNSNKFILAIESGDILGAARSAFTTLKKLKPTIYRYNFLTGSSVKEHSIISLSRCLYDANKKTQAEYSQSCDKPNFLRYVSSWF